MSDYMPMTEDVRSAFCEGAREGSEVFDRWLEQHDREVSVRALQALGTTLGDTAACTEHQRCTCRYALTGLGTQLRRTGK